LTAVARSTLRAGSRASGICASSIDVIRVLQGSESCKPHRHHGDIESS
jgi:hypothetical protein